MSRTIEEQKDQLIQRCDPDELISLLEPDIEDLVEACHEIIALSQDKVLKFLEETDL